MTDLPSDLAAEQAIIGAALFDNSIFEEASLQPEFFHEPTHSRIFAAGVQLVGTGLRADPVTVGSLLTSDPGLVELGGQRYLLDLYDHAPAASVAQEYIRIIYRLWQRRQLIELAKELSASIDPAEMIDQAEARLLAIQTHARDEHLVSAEEAGARVIEQLDNPLAGVGIKTGLKPIDDVTGGFMPGELWMLSGRPSMGKSAIASTAALHVARHGRHPSGKRFGVIEISCEMTIEQMTRRHVCDLAFEMFGHRAPNYSDVRKKRLTADQRQVFNEAMREWRSLAAWRGYYRTGLTVSGIRGLARRQKAVWLKQDIELGLVIIDHVGLIKPSWAARSRTEAQGEVARDTKELAGKPLDCAVLGLVQLARKVEERDDKRPLISDLRDSGEWEENADGVIGAYRPAYYAQRETEPKRHDDRVLWEERKASKHIEAIFNKIREGEAQTVKLWADMGRNAIRGEQPEAVFSSSLFGSLDPEDFR